MPCLLASTTWQALRKSRAVTNRVFSLPVRIGENLEDGYAEGIAKMDSYSSRDT